MLVKCPGCGKEISKNAMICPHCKCSTSSLEKKETKPCRICKTPLVVDDHLSIVYTSTPSIVNGDPVSSSLKYTPCPRCGEPRPILQEPPALPVKPILMIIILLAIVGIAFVAYLKFGVH
jgi:hypothetical protein